MIIRRHLPHRPAARSGCPGAYRRPGTTAPAAISSPQAGEVLDSRTWSAAFERWTATILPLKGRRPSTIAHYREVWRAYLAPLDARTVEGTSSETLAELLAHLLQGGRRDGQPLSPAVVRESWTLLRQVGQLAVDWGWLAVNPMIGVPIPPAPPPAGRTWSQDQVRRFLHQATGHRLFPLFALVLATGLRMAEVLGLCWDDVDWTRAELNVRHGWVRVGRRYHLQPFTKTRHGHRVLPLNDTTLTLLRNWRTRLQAEGGQASGVISQQIFVSRTGRPLLPRNVLRTFRDLSRQAGVPLIRFHDLRHTAATLLMESGVPLPVLAEVLGHSNPHFTARVYTHVQPAMTRDALERLGRLIQPEAEQTIPPAGNRPPPSAPP